MKSTHITLLKVTLALFILWLLTHTSKLNFALLINLLDSPSLLLLTIALYLCVVAISSWRWYQLNSAQQLPLTFSGTIIPTYLGIAFNNLLPGGLGGDFFRCYFLFKKIPDKQSAVMLSILFDRITGLMGIFIAVCCVALFHLNLLNPQKLMPYFLIFCVVLCAGIVMLYFTSAFLPPKIGLSALLTKRYAGKKWLNAILSLLEALRVYRNAKWIIAKCLVASVIIQFFIAATCFLLARMMHFPAIPFVDYIIAISITQIVNLIPITPGGFGIGEAAFANIITLLNPGVSATYATIFLAYRVLGILVYLPGIAVFLFDKQILKESKLVKIHS